jgi:alanine dehydrogenase
MLIIDNRDVTDLLTMADCIRVQENAFRKLPTGGAIHRPRIDLYFPCEREDGYFRWGTMEGANDGYFAIRMKSDIVTWPTDSEGRRTEEKYCVRPGTYCGLIFLVSTRSGEPLAFINDGVLQHMRVGGGAAIGAKYLSREDSRVVGMLGSGGMARTYLEAFTCVRAITTCKVYSPNRDHREAFAREMAAKLKIDVHATSSAREAVSGVDILASCTDSMETVYDAAWIENGMHVTNLGTHEVPDAAFDRFDLFVRQGTMGVEMPENDRFRRGIGHSPAAYVGGTAAQMKRLPSKSAGRTVLGDNPADGADAQPEFADLVTGACKGRTSRDQVTFYRNGGNQGLQFSAVAGWVYAQALERKRGRDLPTQWFLQDVRD